ncbi:uncharacterized protein [Bactrocera oleae]|uniref:uncharacterized protein n=1 Tax=Bactrocera oleae TaxID=104688 RepID=UPI00387E4AE4
MFVLQVLTCLTAEKPDANSLILMQSATPNAEMDEERIEEIRRKKRSPINILLKPDIIAQKSLRLLRLFSSKFTNFSCYYYLICENIDTVRNQLTYHAFWIPIWSAGITWISNYKQISASKPKYSSQHLENLRAVIIGVLGTDSCENNFKDACSKAST